MKFRGVQSFTLRSLWNHSVRSWLAARQKGFVYWPPGLVTLQWVGSLLVFSCPRPIEVRNRNFSCVLVRKAAEPCSSADKSFVWKAALQGGG